MIIDHRIHKKYNEEMSWFFLSLGFYVKSKFEHVGSQKSAILTLWEALDLDYYEFLHLLKAEFTKSTEFSAPKMAKTEILELLDSSKLISRKILVTVKS